jgi:hypothetical protein
MHNSYCAVILNRNLGNETDTLRDRLLLLGFSNVVVVDSSTDISLQSKYANVIADDLSTLKLGYRMNRGFNLGLDYAIKNFNPDWVLCLPVDSYIEKIDLDGFEKESKSYSKIVAYTFLNESHPYFSLFKKNIALIWNIDEGPIMVKTNFVKEFITNNQVNIFDNNNFRGYMSFKELALRVYANNKGIGAYKSFIIREREEFLLNFAELMKTESYSKNKELLIVEGSSWLREKYGFLDRWSLENIVRLTYDEFLLCNPKYLEIKL